MTSNARTARISKIRSDIEKYGLSVTLVTGGPSPRFAYTIGLRDIIGFDLMMPGATYFSDRQIHQIINACSEVLKDDPSVRSIDLPSLGSFELRFADDSWTRPMALGALDFYQTEEVRVAQIVPDLEHMTIDVPDMGQEREVTLEPVWRWLDQPWDYPVPPTSLVTTNLAALRGAPITELVRWEDAEWEMFAGSGPDVTAEEARAVPLGTLVGADPSLAVAVTTRNGEGYWRENASSVWQEWKRRQDT